MENNPTISPSSRMTNQRLEILTYLESTGEHPTADKIYLEVRKKLPKIELGTSAFNSSENKVKRSPAIKNIIQKPTKATKKAVFKKSKIMSFAFI